MQDIIPVCTLKEIKEINKLKYKDLAKIIGCSPRTIRRWEQNMGDLHVLCDFWDISIDFYVIKIILQEFEPKMGTYCSLLLYNLMEPKNNEIKMTPSSLEIIKLLSYMATIKKYKNANLLRNKDKTDLIKMVESVFIFK